MTYFYNEREDTARYAGLLRGLWPLAKAFFGPSGKKGLIMLFWPILGHFWCTVLTLETLSSNLKEGFKKKIPHMGDKASLDRCG